MVSTCFHLSSRVEEVTSKQIDVEVNRTLLSYNKCSRTVKGFNMIMDGIENTQKGPKWFKNMERSGLKMAPKRYDDQGPKWPSFR